MLRNGVFIWVLLFCCSLSYASVNVMYYSPSSIGDDVISDEIDFYTSPYMSLHNVFIKIMSERYGVTHIIVNNRWDACDDCHADFLTLLMSYNMSLIISLVVPTNGETAKGTSSLLKLVVRELGPYNSIFVGFYLPVPQKKISDDEWTYYFSYANELPRLYGGPTYQVVVEFPINKASLAIMTNYPLETVNTWLWVVTIYADFPKYVGELYQLWLGILPNNTNVLPMIVSSNFDDRTRGLNDSLQDANVKQAIYYANKFWNTDALGFFEFNDEWWTSAETDSGFDIEGCPNSNPYAHTSCGYRVGDGVLNVEFLGLYALNSSPFRCCLIPKKVVKTVQIHWKQQNTSDIYDPICAVYLPFWVSQLPFPYSAAILALPFFLCYFDFWMDHLSTRKET